MRVDDILIMAHLAPLLMRGLRKAETPKAYTWAGHIFHTKNGGLAWQRTYHRSVAFQRAIEDMGAHIQTFVKDSLSKAPSGRRITFSIISRAKAQDLENIIGEPIAHGGIEVLIDDRVIHVNNRHQLTLHDWAQLPDVANNYDVASLSRDAGHKGEKRVMFAKRINELEAYLYVAQVHSSIKQGQRLKLITYVRDHIHTVINHLETKAKYPGKIHKWWESDKA